MYGARIGGGKDGNGGVIIISDGTVTAKGSQNGAGIGGGSGNGSKVIISGGEIMAIGGSHDSGSDGGAGIGGGGWNGNGSEVTISGGEVTAIGGNNSAGIGGGRADKGGIITISGGKVTAVGGSDKNGYGGGAGLGGGKDGNGGEIIISDGIVTATGGSGLTGGGGAGLGGGNGRDGSGGTIIIRGGEITAKGGSSQQGDGGAGIGGGYGGSGDEIIISDGKITAIGGSDGAGLGGGGWSDSSGRITISSGIIKATGGNNGAGIGGGRNNSDGGEIIINGGSVEAVGGDNGAGIGGGRDGSGGNVAINGGTVNVASVNAKGIGGGYNGVSQGSCVITGGSVMADSMGVQAYYDAAQLVPVYLTVVTLRNVASKKTVSSLTTSVSYDYGLNDMRTNEDGKLYLYLPENAEITAAQTTDGESPSMFDNYRGSIKTLNDGTASGQLTLYHIPTAKDPVPVQSVAESSNISFMASDIAENKDSDDILNITGIVAYPATVTAEASLNSEAVTVTGVSSGSTFMVVAVSDGTETVEVAVPIVVTAFHAVISPAADDFDKYRPNDVETAITWNGAHSVTDIKAGGVSIGSNSFTVSGDTLTVRQEYLSAQPPGSLVLTVEFDNGNPATLTVNIADTALPSINPTERSYDLNNPSDVSTQIIRNGARSVTGVVYRSNQLIISDAYTIVGDTLTIKNDYLYAQNFSIGDTAEFEICFDDGSSVMFNIDIVGSSPGRPSESAPAITTSSLPGGTVGIEYSQILRAASSTAVTWSVYEGDLPDGLTLSNDGVISGIPATCGAVSFIVKAENNSGNDTKTLDIEIGSAPPAKAGPAITTAALPGGKVSMFYSRTLTAIGDMPITWTIDNGSLPDGLMLTEGGIISGTPKVSGTFNFTVKATNSRDSDTKSLSIMISRPASGGSTGSSSSPVPIIDPDRKLDQPVIAIVKLTPTVVKDGKAKTALPLQLVRDAINKAANEAARQGKTENGIGVSLVIKIPDNAKSLDIVLDRTAIKLLVDSRVRQFKIDSGLLTLNFDLEALKQIQTQSNGDVTITLTPVTELSSEAKAFVGTRAVYNITLGYVRNGRTMYITSLGKGIATLSIPYVPGQNETVGYIYGVYVDRNGKVVRINGSVYDTNTRNVIFNTNHLSVYGVGYTAPGTKFTDMEKHWAQESTDYVVSRGLLLGTSDSTFSPDTAISRGMLLTALGRLADVDVSGYKTSSFNDVKADSIFLPYIEWAYKKGIIQVIGNNMSAPDRAITREEIAVILQNYAKAAGYTLPVTREAATFADNSSISSGYMDTVKALLQSGIMMGGPDNKFEPKSNVTRAEAATMLHRYIKLTIDPATAQGWSKNDGGQYLYYKDGKALTGWQAIDGISDKKRYYFTRDAIMVSGKWMKIDGKWYYFYTDGALAVNTKIDGYEVDKNGVRMNRQQ